jgi:hypothetical protein
VTHVAGHQLGRPQRRCRPAHWLRLGVALSCRGLGVVGHVHHGDGDHGGRPVTVLDLEHGPDERRTAARRRMSARGRRSSGRSRRRGTGRAVETLCPCCPDAMAARISRGASIRNVHSSTAGTGTGTAGGQPTSDWCPVVGGVRAGSVAGVHIRPTSPPGVLWRTSMWWFPDSDTVTVTVTVTGGSVTGGGRSRRRATPRPARRGNAAGDSGTGRPWTALRCGGTVWVRHSPMSGRLPRLGPSPASQPD